MKQNFVWAALTAIVVWIQVLEEWVMLQPILEKYHTIKLWRFKKMEK